MMNMSHCRFHNTLMALRECQEHWDDDLSPEELKCKIRLQKIINMLAEDPEDAE